MTHITSNLKFYTDLTNTAGHLRNSDLFLISRQGSISDIAARALRRGYAGNFRISRKPRCFGGSSQRPKKRLKNMDWLISQFGIKAS